MWRVKFKGVRIHGGSTQNNFRNGSFRSKHFAIESRFYYLHLSVYDAKHADIQPLHHVVGSGLPERFTGTLSASFTTNLGSRFSTSHHIQYAYGRETLDYLALAVKQHDIIHRGHDG